MTKTKVEAVKAARVWCLAALLAFAGLAHADLVGPVVAIQDGDPDGHPNSPAYGHLKLPHLN